jgi:hypothetical protein
LRCFGPGLPSSQGVTYIYINFGKQVIFKDNVAGGHFGELRVFKHHLARPQKSNCARPDASRNKMETRSRLCPNPASSVLRPALLGGMRELDKIAKRAEGRIDPKVCLRCRNHHLCPARAEMASATARSRQARADNQQLNARLAVRACDPGTEFVLSMRASP